MENQTSFDALRQEVINYMELRTALIKAVVAEKSAKITALLASSLLVAGLAFFAMLFLSIAAGFYCAQLMGSNFKGFGVIAIVYILLAVVLAKYKKVIIEQWLINKIIRIVYDSEDDE